MKAALGVDIGNVIINNRLNDLKKLDEKGYAGLLLSWKDLLKR
jgi:hypothetical protein